MNAEVWVTPAENPWTAIGAHRSSRKVGQELLRGEEGTPGNFRLVLVRDEGPGSSGPRHRHNFDQVRVPLEGRKSVGRGRWIRAGEAGYFPEGVWYGPERPSGPSVGLTWQFGAASGLGFMSSGQEARAMAELGARGVFREGRYLRDGDEGRTQDSYEAIWEHVQGAPITYPAGISDRPIVLRYAALEWANSDRAAGVSRRVLARFGSCGPEISFLRLEEGATGDLGVWGAVTTAVVLTGSVSVEGHPANRWQGFAVAGGKAATVKAEEATEMVIVRLPVISDHILA